MIVPRPHNDDRPSGQVRKDIVQKEQPASKSIAGKRQIRARWGLPTAMAKTILYATKQPTGTNGPLNSIVLVCADELRDLDDLMFESRTFRL